MSANAILFRARASRIAALKLRRNSIIACLSVDNIFADLIEDLV